MNVDGIIIRTLLTCPSPPQIITISVSETRCCHVLFDKLKCPLRIGVNDAVRFEGLLCKSVHGETKIAVFEYSVSSFMKIIDCEEIGKYHGASKFLHPISDCNTVSYAGRVSRIISPMLFELDDQLQLIGADRQPVSIGDQIAVYNYRKTCDGNGINVLYPCPLHSDITANSCEDAINSFLSTRLRLHCVKHLNGLVSDSLLDSSTWPFRYKCGTGRKRLHKEYLSGSNCIPFNIPSLIPLKDLPRAYNSASWCIGWVGDQETIRDKSGVFKFYFPSGSVTCPSVVLFNGCLREGHAICIDVVKLISIDYPKFLEPGKPRDCKNIATLSQQVFTADLLVNTTAIVATVAGAQIELLDAGGYTTCLPYYHSGNLFTCIPLSFNLPVVHHIHLEQVILRKSRNSCILIGWPGTKVSLVLQKCPSAANIDVCGDASLYYLDDLKAGRVQAEWVKVRVLVSQILEGGGNSGRVMAMATDGRAFIRLIWLQPSFVLKPLTEWYEVRGDLLKKNPLGPDLLVASVSRISNTVNLSDRLLTIAEYRLSGA